MRLKLVSMALLLATGVASATDNNNHFLTSISGRGQSAQVCVWDLARQLLARSGYSEYRLGDSSQVSGSWNPFSSWYSIPATGGGVSRPHVVQVNVRFNGPNCYPVLANGTYSFILSYGSTRYWVMGQNRGGVYFNEHVPTPRRSRNGGTFYCN